MEAGASARHVNEIRQSGSRPGSRTHGTLRVGYASLGTTISIGTDGITATEAHTELPQLLQNSPRHADWVVAVAVGVACAAKAILGFLR